LALINGKSSFVSELGTARDDWWYLEFPLATSRLIENFFLEGSSIVVDETVQELGEQSN
jgi:hypothetical protein